MTNPPPDRRARTVTPQPPGQGTGPVGTRAGRLQQLRQARRRRAAAVTALLVTLGVLVAVLVVPQLTAAPGPAATASPPAGRPTGATGGPALVVLTGQDGRASAAALIGDEGADGHASVLLVPAGLIVDVPGFGPGLLTDVARLPLSDGAAHGLADLLGLAVSGTWELREGGLVGLVDAVGGVRVDVDRDVLATGAGGATVVAVPAGPQRLDGRAALAYATWLATGEPEQARLARFSAVWQALLARLPTRADTAARIVGALGDQSAATVADLPGLLAGLAAHARTETVDSDVLPTTVLATGGPDSALTLDQSAAPAVVTRLFPHALRAGGGVPLVRVLVQNGVGTPGLGAAARDRLVAAGFAYLGGGNAPQLGAPRTLVVVPDATRASRALGARVAAALDVPADAVRVAGQRQSVARVLVVLGADFPGDPATATATATARATDVATARATDVATATPTAGPTTTLTPSRSP